MLIKIEKEYELTEPAVDFEELTMGDVFRFASDTLERAITNERIYMVCEHTREENKVINLATGSTYDISTFFAKQVNVHQGSFSIIPNI